MHEPHQPIQDPAPASRRLLGRAPRTRSVVAATGLLVLGISSFAVAQTDLEDFVREGVRNGTTTAETEIITNVGSTTEPKGGYSTRQSNLSASGGGAIYGCRSKAGGSAAKPRPQNPCVRANNLSTGLAFEFNATHGDIGGLLSVGGGGDSKKPFITNATGVATGLNADEVDGLDAAQIVTAARLKAGLDADTVDGKDSTDLQARFAQVAANGAVGEGQTRGVASGGVTRTGAGVYAVTFTGNLGNCALSATITGADFGYITATPVVAGGNTTVAVRTAAPTDPTATTAAPVPADRPFHLVAHC